MTIQPLLRFEDLKALGIVRSWTQLARLIEQRGLPPGRRMGAFRVWREEEIEKWLESLPHALEAKAAPKGRAKTQLAKAAKKLEVA